MAHDPVDLDALLRAALSIEPSVEFLPRLRDRIAAAPPSRSWRCFWLAIPAAAAAACILALSLAPRQATTMPAARAPASRGPGDTSEVRPAGEPRPAVSEPRPAVNEPRPAVNEPRPATSGRRAATSGRRSAGSEQYIAEVLVDIRQREALVAFIQLAQRGALTDDVFRTTTEPPAVIAEQIGAIEVNELGLSAIVPGGVLPPDEHK